MTPEVSRPELVTHSDWIKDPKKRWCVIAVLKPDGRFSATRSRSYLIDALEPVGDIATFLDRLRERVAEDATVPAGFDFPIGLPERYTLKAGIVDFRIFATRFPSLHLEMIRSFSHMSVAVRLRIFVFLWLQDWIYLLRSLYLSS